MNYVNIKLDSACRISFWGSLMNSSDISCCLNVFGECVCIFPEPIACLALALCQIVAERITKICPMVFRILVHLQLITLTTENQQYELTHFILLIILSLSRKQTSFWDEGQYRYKLILPLISCVFQCMMQTNANWPDVPNIPQLPYDLDLKTCSSRLPFCLQSHCF